MIRIIFENRRLLTELTLDQAFARFESRKFIDAVERKEDKNLELFNKLKRAKAFILNSCPDDISKEEQANLINWQITLYIKNDLTIHRMLGLKHSRYISDLVKELSEIFFHIKRQHLDRLLKYKALEQYQSIQEFIDAMKVTEPLYKKHLEEKDFKDASKGTELIYEDDDWKIYIPRNKGAACQLGKGTTWCTAAPGLDYYKGYHTDDNPLIVFINKREPDDKYQFNYDHNQFMDKNNQTIKNADPANKHYLFYRLNQLLKKCSDKLPENIVRQINYYNFEYLDDNAFSIYNDGKMCTYKNGKLNSINDKPSMMQEVWFENGEWTKPSKVEIWHENGVIHRKDKPAVIRADGSVEFWTRGHHEYQKDYNVKKLKEFKIRITFGERL